MTEQTPLSDVTLTMIVRDELMNPAGGLHAVLSRHLPYFQKVVVLDTGSVDGTRQLLEEMAGEYSQLRVYDANFAGYGKARLRANEYVTTPYSFMLDADERLHNLEEFSQFWKRINQQKIYGETVLGLNFNFSDVYEGVLISGWGWNPRLLLREKVRFRNLTVWEHSTLEGEPGIPTAVGTILHFQPETKHGHLRSSKRRDWYGNLESHLSSTRAPSQLPQFCSWKTPDPTTLLRYGIDVGEEIEKLEKLGLHVHQGIMEILEKYQQENQV